jgi:hypothetical protein
MGEKRNEYKLLIGKPEGRGSLRKPRHMWVDNIKMVHGEIGYGGVDWIGLGQSPTSGELL